MNRQARVKNMVMTGLLAAVLVVLAQILVPIGAVPFTMAVLGVVLIGLLLPPAWAAACLGVYMVLGFAGVPVFAGFMAGPAVLLGPTGGYLFGYFALTLCLSFAVKRGGGVLWQALAGVAGLVGLYLFGTVWYVMLTGAPFLSGLAMCVVPFILPDLAKLALGIGVAAALQRRLAPGRARG